MPRKRERSRSHTPEVQWDKLPDHGAVPGFPPPEKPEKVAKSLRKTEKEAAPPPEKIEKEKQHETGGDIQLTEAEKAARYEAAVGMESRAWRFLMVRLAGLVDDRRIKAYLKEKHPELIGLVKQCGASGEKGLTIQEARAAAKDWFGRRLRGSNNHGPAARAQVCNQVQEQLKARANELRRDNRDPGEVLDRADEREEGPVICTMLHDELRGSKYETLWISRDRAGVYVIGDEGEDSSLPNVDQIGARIHPRVRVVMKILKDRLTVDGFFHDGEDTLIPAKVPIGPFLGVYFEGLTLKKALAAWTGPEPLNDSGHTNGTSSSSNGGQKDVKGPTVTLPPGWELRESRSKKGVYYYAHPAKGLTSFERPTA